MKPHYYAEESQEMQNSPLFLASDHAGFLLKEYLKKNLEQEKIPFEDLGPHSVDRVDYPDFAAKVAEIISSGKGKRGLLICGTGLGIGMTANKFPGVRATPASSIYAARMAREHNDANILCLGSRLVAPEFAWEILKTFLEASFQGGRHQNRLDKIKTIEEKLNPK